MAGPVSELDVVVHFDPADDLVRRARFWNYEFPANGLSDLAVFGAALAQAEADAWYHDEGHIATRALEDRRFLLADRLTALGRSLAGRTGERRAQAERSKPWQPCSLLGEEHRVAPLLSGDEGLFPPGEDSFGHLDQRPLDSVWCGAVVPAEADPLRAPGHGQNPVGGVRERIPGKCPLVARPGEATAAT